VAISCQADRCAQPPLNWLLALLAGVGASKAGSFDLPQALPSWQTARQDCQPTD